MIAKDQEKRVFKDSFRFLERNAVLSEIQISLFVIPFEQHVRLLGYSHISYVLSTM